jgi:quercetin dioxygenase-like cupin family protein
MKCSRSLTVLAVKSSLSRQISSTSGGAERPAVVGSDRVVLKTANRVRSTSAQGGLPVAILSTDEFDALDVDTRTVLFGDPSKEGLFALRLKLPEGYSVPPHTHPVDEAVTVISGTFSLGMGETADQSKAQALPAGSFFALPPGTAHYVFIDEETVIQISTVGPWGLTYVNPEDDPRQKSQ